MGNLSSVNNACPSLKGAAMGTLLNAIITLERELHDAHASYKTLTDELHDDHASYKTLTDELHDDHASYKTLTDELHDSHATFKTVVDDVKALLNNIRSYSLNHALGNPGLAIKTNFDVENGTAIDYVLAGVLYTLSANTTCNTGTSANFAADKWGIFLVSVDSSGTLTATWEDNSNAGYDSEAEAIAALPSTPTDELAIGYITVQADAANTFTAGTDALTGGTGGNPAQTTNYYNMDNPNGFGTAVSTSTPATLTASKVGSLTANKVGSLTADKVDSLTASKPTLLT